MALWRQTGKINLRWLRRLRELSHSLSVRAGIYCVCAVAVALMAVVLAPLVPEDLANLLGGEAVDRILTILASSMLAVVTFSLSTLIASYSVAGSSAPFRATAVILRDTSAQTALSTFLGAFIFSVVSLVALSTRYYGPKGRVILFIVTVAVLSAVVWRIIGWIGRLSGLGQLGNVINEVENTAIKSIQNQPFPFGDNAEAEGPPPDAFPVRTDYAGFVQAIDLQNLSDLAEQEDWEIYLEATAGKFVVPGFVLARVAARSKISEESAQKIRAGFFLGKNRTFDDDPRFGFIVLSEIGSQALSPGVNDPGTAIQIIGSLMRLVSEVHKKMQNPQPPVWSSRLHVKLISIENILDDAFHAISRDGASVLEVNLLLQKCFRSMSAFSGFSRAAHALSKKSLQRCKMELKLSSDYELVKAIALADS